MKPSPLMTLAEVSRETGRSKAQLPLDIDEGKLLALSIRDHDNAGRDALRVVRLSVGLKPGPQVLGEWKRILDSIRDWLLPHPTCMLTAKDVAHALSCSAQHVRALYDAGHLRGVHVGSLHATRLCLRFHASGLVQFVLFRIFEKNGRFA